MSSTKPQCEPLQRPLATSTATKRESSINRTSKRPQTNALTESMDKSSLKQQKQNDNASDSERKESDVRMQAFLADRNDHLRYWLSYGGAEGEATAQR
ncbi:hypothetical protein LTR37_019833 [Vermiconidia calcicola]|uniref:Uncharacterized protein n=1 Tax=Vermiconidia calcicola TaxID=1690605 RepID=A0ACC3MD15_9PEZI|nr:hypothetical protein LTR37_019833 [Vermiconidia calcicola]